MRGGRIAYTLCLASGGIEADIQHILHQLGRLLKELEKCNIMFDIGVRSAHHAECDVLNHRNESVEPDSFLWVDCVAFAPISIDIVTIATQSAKQWHENSIDIVANAIISPSIQLHLQLYRH